MMSQIDAFGTVKIIMPTHKRGIDEYVIEP